MAGARGVITGEGDRHVTIGRHRAGFGRVTVTVVMIVSVIVVAHGAIRGRAARMACNAVHVSAAAHREVEQCGQQRQ
jgi:hypothetical protein